MSPEYDLHIDKTVAGGLAVTEVRNSDTTNASSNAMLRARTETGGGDSILSLGLQGKVNWILQADRSDSEKLKIGTTMLDSLDTGDSWFTIQRDGYIGIGTTTPRSKFTVGNSTTSNGTPGILIADPQTRIELEETDATANNKRWDILADQESLVGRVVDDADTVASQWMRVHRTGVTVDSVTFLNGDVGIGTEFPNFKLDVRGTIGNNTTTYHSDIRWKKNVSTVVGALDKVNNLRGVNFEWKIDGFPEMLFSEGTKLGFIAQEVEAILPELVDTGKDGYKSVQYANMVPLLVEAIKQLKKELEALKEVKAENVALTREIKDIKEAIGL